MRLRLAACLLGTALCSLVLGAHSSAQIISNITVPDYSFSTYNSGSSYANQYPVPYSPYPTAQIFADWSTSSYNYQIYPETSTGKMGTYDGSTVVRVNFPGNGPSGFDGPGAVHSGWPGYDSSLGSTTESLNPVVTSIDNNAIYTLTFSLANIDNTAGDVTIAMLSTTSAPDTTDYSGIPDPQPPYTPYGPNPTPTITTTKTLAYLTIPAATINLQANGDFVDYSVSFSTMAGLNPDYVGQNLSLAINVRNGSFTEFDNARLTETTVPEPGTWALMLGGVAILGCFARRGFSFSR